MPWCIILRPCMLLMLMWTHPCLKFTCIANESIKSWLINDITPANALSVLIKCIELQYWINLWRILPYFTTQSHEKGAFVETFPDFSAWNNTAWLNKFWIWSSEMFVKQTLLVMLADCFARMRMTKKKRKQLLFKSHFTSSLLEALRGCLKVKVLFSRFCSLLVLHKVLLFSALAKQSRFSHTAPKHYIYILRFLVLPLHRGLLLLPKWKIPPVSCDAWHFGKNLNYNVKQTLWFSTKAFCMTWMMDLIKVHGILT